MLSLFLDAGFAEKHPRSSEGAVTTLPLFVPLALHWVCWGHTMSTIDVKITCESQVVLEPATIILEGGMPPLAGPPVSGMHALPLPRSLLNSL